MCRECVCRCYITPTPLVTRKEERKRIYIIHKDTYAVKCLDEMERREDERHRRRDCRVRLRDCGCRSAAAVEVT